MATRDSYRPGTPSWVDLGSPDPAASAAFYGALFGWTCEEGPPDAGGYRMCLLDGRPAAGIGPSQGEPGEHPWWTTYVSVADVEATTSLVAANGGSVLVPPMGVLTFGRMAVCTDPAGATFSLWQPLEHIGAHVVNEPGALCWNELTTRHLDGAVAFYSAVFGWGAKRSDAGGGAYVEWQLDDASVGGALQMGEEFPPEVPDHWMVYFAVGDCGDAARTVRELGGDVSVEPFDIPDVGRAAVVNDPHGAVFTVIELAR